MIDRVRFVLILQLCLMGALLAVAADLHEHSTIEMVRGVNRWGYRGEVAKQRAFDERRILLLGGTRAFEADALVLDTVVARVRYMVRQWVTLDRGPVTGINIADVDLPRGGYERRLAHFSYLQPDVICVIPDLGAIGHAPKHAGLVERLTGYAFALRPLEVADRWLGSIAGSAIEDDDIGSVSKAVQAAVALAPTVVAIPEPENDDEVRQRDTLRTALQSVTGGPHPLRLIQLVNGPNQVVAGVSEPAAVVQIEPVVSELLLQVRPLS